MEPPPAPWYRYRGGAPFVKPRQDPPSPQRACKKDIAVDEGWRSTRPVSCSGGVRIMISTSLMLSLTISVTRALRNMQ